MIAINIDWDSDGVRNLPNIVQIPKGMIDEEEISDFLTDLTGFCHKGFELVDSVDKLPINQKQFEQDR